MAIAAMQKVMIVAHRSQATALLGALQDAGIVQILDAERAMLTKEWPELIVESKRHRSLEETTDRLGRAISFLKPYSEKDATSLFSPFIEVDEKRYSQIVSEKDSLSYLGQVEQAATQLEKLTAEAENLNIQLTKLMPWQTLSVPVDQLGGLATSTVFVGQVGDSHFDLLGQRLAELGAAAEVIAPYNRTQACVIVCLNEVAADAQKVLRAAEFEAAVFEGLTGTADENIQRIQGRLDEIKGEKEALANQTVELAKDKLNLQILFDHLQNLHGRLEARSTAPATDHAIFLEGWVKKNQFARLERLAADFDACDVAAIEPAQDEEIPVEIDNGPAVKPFEMITRLYGMPARTDVDPTAYLAPFFTIFFGVCLTDAAYGLFLIAALWWVMKKFRGDKGPLKMFMICAVSTVIAGALTGGWCSDAVTVFLGNGTPDIIDTPFEAFRDKIMLFDPMKEPMTFFVLAIGLGYIQIIFGLCIALYNNLRQKNYAAAAFEQVTWLLLLNSLLLLGLSKAGVIPAGIAGVCGWIAIVQGVLIFLFTERNSGLAGRLGGGVFGLFGAVFYFGDLLSYVRLMALGMVTAGLGMAVNILCQLVMDVPYVGFILGAIIFVGGHLFNLAMSLLSSFVHSLRLQFVEFFPKFMVGGGKDFIPFKTKFMHIEIKE